jgi:uncharacterized protein (TIGR02588 family)
MKKMGKNWLEWTVFALSVVLVTCTLAYLAYDGMTIGDAPPSIEIRVGVPTQGQHNFIVPVSITNHGDQTAEGVQIEVALEAEGKEMERSEFAVAFLPRRATREGWVAFQTDPRTAQKINARVLGYEKP